MVYYYYTNGVGQHQQLSLVRQNRQTDQSTVVQNQQPTRSLLAAAAVELVVVVI